MTADAAGLLGSMVVHHTFPQACGTHHHFPSASLLSCPQVKVQTVKTSVEAATLLLRIDDIVSAL